MTKITFENGKPVMRDGKVGTGQECCCESDCPRCMRDGKWLCGKNTKASCEDCTRTYKCHESLQTNCDGTCPEGTTPSPPLSFEGRIDQYYCWYPAYGFYVTATVGCGKIISVSIDPPGAVLSGYAKLGRVAPTVTATVTQTGGSASGAVLAVNLTETTDYCGFPIWYIDSISVVSPGSGYTIYEPEGNAEITIEDAPGDTEDGYGAWAYVSEVDENGGIVSVYVSELSNRWRESASAPPIVAPVTINTNSWPGSGAVITPVIDTETSSQTFGHITSFTVEDGGSGYITPCSRSRDVASCAECPPLQSPESATCETITANDGKPCGTWTPGFECGVPCHECNSVGSATPECPNFQMPCEQIFPDSPYRCCEIDGERRCRPVACYPGARITLQFRKKVGCEASGNDPNNILGFVDEGEDFELVISGGSILDCSDSSQISSAPCQTQWTLSTGCVVSDLSCDTSVSPICQSCYEFLGWSSCRGDCNGNCA